MRQALQLDIAEYRLFGTVHDSAQFPSTPDKTPIKRTGVLLLSFGQQPRSWVGDLGSSIADRLDKLGYPTFRFDMPGLGDSPGDIPVHLEELWREIQLGAHDRPLMALCEELVHRFSLKGLVVGGFCGGAITALYSVTSRSPLVQGLILLEPELALTRTVASMAGVSNAPLTVDSFQEKVSLIWRRLRSPESWSKLVTGRADYRFWLKLWYGVIDYAARKLATIGRHSKPLPQETNLRLMEAWNLARRKRIPTLVASVGSTHRSNYYRAYGLQPGVSDPKTALQWIEVPNTTHAMLTGGAKEAIALHVENWVETKFPLPLLNPGI